MIWHWFNLPNYPAIYAQSFTINVWFLCSLSPMVVRGFSLRDVDVDMYHASYFNTQMPRWRIIRTNSKVWNLLV